MTTPIVPSISDEQLAELEEAATDSKLNIYRPFGWDHSVRCGNHLQTDQDFLCASSPQTILSLIARLRAAEADVERRGKALSEIMTEVDLNIRPTVRDIINGMPDANDIYGYCDAIDRIAMAVWEPKP